MREKKEKVVISLQIDLMKYIAGGSLGKHILFFSFLSFHYTMFRILGK